MSSQTAKPLNTVCVEFCSVSDHTLRYSVDAKVEIGRALQGAGLRFQMWLGSTISSLLLCKWSGSMAEGGKISTR